MTAVLLLDSLERATKLALLPDGRMLFSEQQTGRVRVVERDGRLLEEPFFDAGVNHARERGGLGVTADPDFAENGFVYYFFVPSRSGRDTGEKDDVDSIRVVRLRARGNVAADSTTILRLPSKRGPFHNAGNVLFGPDGALYVSLGELNRNANLHSQLHGGRNPRGKILRYAKDGSVREDNPLGDRNPIYVYGLRNPYDFTFDAETGLLYISENGPAGHDEINVALPGENLGWPLVWGYADHWYERLPRAWIGSNFRPPLWESYRERLGPTGIVVLRSDAYGADFRGRVLFGEVNHGRVRQLEVDAERGIATGMGTFVDGLGLVTDLAVSDDGRVYVLALSSLYRIDPAGTSDS